MVATFIVDTDIHGVNDDAFALHYLLAHGHIPSMITTCTGNTLASASARDAHSVLQSYDLDLRVQSGPDRPTGCNAAIRRAHEAVRGELAATVHLGALGSERALSASAEPSAIDYDVDPGEGIAYLALGPLGNLSDAFARGLDASRVEHLVFSGGAFTVPGNVGPYAEFNVFADPIAAAHVLRAGIPRVTVVPLDVTARVTYGRAEFERIAPRPSVFGRDLRLTKHETFAADPEFREPTWDLVAAIVMFQPEVIVRSRRAGVAVDSSAGATLGATTLLPGGTPADVEVVLEVDEGAIREIMCRSAEAGVP